MTYWRISLVNEATEGSFSEASATKPELSQMVGILLHATSDQIPGPNQLPQPFGLKSMK